MPAQTHTFADDGRFPNSRLPLVVFRAAFQPHADPTHIEQRLAQNDWTNSWRNGIYPFHHYHSTSHEVLVLYAGHATVRFGGPTVGADLTLAAGDAIVIPAGVAHCCQAASADLGVIGAYPEGRAWDLLHGRPTDRPQADQNIAALPLPKTDPATGAQGELLRLWHVTP